MPKPITFTDKKEAKEFADVMKSRGWDALLHYDATTNTWVVLVSLVKEGRRVEESKVPTSLALIMAEEEKKTEGELSLKPHPVEKAKELGRTLRRGGTRIVKGAPLQAAKAVSSEFEKAASGKSLEPTLSHMAARVKYRSSSGYKALSVTEGMSKSIPVPGGGRHGYLARIGEMKAVEVAELPGRGRGSMSSMEKPSIAQVSRASIAATSSGIAAGAPRGARFRFDVTAMRMKLPRTRKKVEEEIATEKGVKVNATD